jgi:hypothetical protein
MAESSNQNEQDIISGEFNDYRIRKTYAIINLTTQHYIPVIQLFDEAIHCYTIHNTLTLTYPPPKKNTLKSNHTTSICVTETISSAYLVRFISFFS